MAFIDLSRRQLRHFVALATHRSFTDAAKVVNLSQPALSVAIRRLEEQLGTRLFQRSARRVVLTEAGEELLTFARRILDNMDDAIASMTDLARLGRGRIRVACLPSLAVRFVPTVLRGLMDANPGLSFAIHDGFNEAIIERVRSGEADCGLAALDSDTAHLRAEPVLRDALMLVVPDGHPLIAGAPPTLARVAEHPFIEVSPDSTTRVLVDRGFAEAGARPARTISTNGVTTACGFVASGFGVTLLPALSRGLVGEQPNVRFLRLAEPAIDRTISLLQRDDMSLSPAAAAFRQAVLAEARRFEPRAPPG